MGGSLYRSFSFAYGWVLFWGTISKILVGQFVDDPVGYTKHLLEQWRRFATMKQRS